VKISKETLYPYLIFSQPYKYNDKITLHPVKMRKILEFQLLSQALTVRKNSRFPDKKIIKMTYLDFLIYASMNPDLGKQYNVPDLHYYYSYTLALLNLVCPGHEITFNKFTGEIYVNKCKLTPDMFDDLRRIIILQNDIVFDIDEFINKDTEDALKKAQAHNNRNQDESGIEDYVDSLSIALQIPETEIMEMPIRKFWRYIKRYNLHESYTICKTGEASGMVTFKEPIKHWMISIEEDDLYKSLKTDEKSLKDKISGVNS